MPLYIGGLPRICQYYYYYQHTKHRSHNVFNLKSNGMKGLVEKLHGFCASCADLLSSSQKSILLLLKYTCTCRSTIQHSRHTLLFRLQVMHILPPSSHAYIATFTSCTHNHCHLQVMRTLPAFKSCVHCHLQMIHNICCPPSSHAYIVTFKSCMHCPPSRHAYIVHFHAFKSCIHWHLQTMHILLL